VKSLGADQVIDYTQEDFTKNGQTYDIIFDAVGKTRFSQIKQALKKNGYYLHTVMVLPEIHNLWAKMTTGQKIVGGTVTPRTEALCFLKTLSEQGQLKPVIDRCFELAQMVEAHRYVETGHKTGNVVITVEQSYAK
jgi:NADPH:quinone reductase-like Zn-dependent oxidoreductase